MFFIKDLMEIFLCEQQGKLMILRDIPRKAETEPARTGGIIATVSLIRLDGDRLVVLELPFCWDDPQKTGKLRSSIPLSWVMIL